MNSPYQQRGASNGPRPGNGFGDRRPRELEALPQMSLAGVKFAGTPDPELFNTIAKDVATAIAKSPKGSNKPTQLRRFYDEICLWEQKVHRMANEDEFQKALPFIRMLNAKAAYAAGRKAQGVALVDENFRSLLEHGLKQVDSRQTFRTFKTFMEAVMGFYKAERPGNN